MILQLFFLGIYMLFAVCICIFNRDKKNNGAWLFFFLAAAFILRVAVAAFSKGYETDMNCFRAWSGKVISVAPWRFYDSIWCDYPPGYMYVLAFQGLALKLLGGISHAFSDIIIKLPACFCDILSGLFIYRLAKKHINGSTAFNAALLYLFCPAIITNSAVWGQVDSVFTLVLFASLFALDEEKYFISALLLGLSLSFKMQTLMFAPVFAFVFFERIRDNKRLWKTLVFCIAIFIGVPLLMAIPFTALKPLSFIFKLYASTMGQYPYASLNAFNLFALLGANQTRAGEKFLFLTYRIWGIIFIAAVIVYICSLYLRGKGKGKIYYTAALLMTFIFVFSSDMHERYLFPAMLLYVASFAFTGDRKTLYIAGAVALSQYVNVGYLYNMSLHGVYHIPPDDILLKIGSMFTVGVALWAIYNFRELYMDSPYTFKLKGGEEKKMTRKDISLVAIVTLIYTVIAFVNLGDAKAPQTTFADNKMHEVTLSFDTEKRIGSVIYYKGLGNGQTQLLLSSGESAVIADTDECFKWHRVECDVSAKEICFRTLKDGITIYEVGFTDFYTGELLKPAGNNSPWLDEQDLVPDVISFKNGTYFDEIYHARTAFENIEGIYPYEISHPPLGKLIIALGIKMFGMNPFGWRFMGTLFGIMMLPLMYMFGKRIFKNTTFALYTMLLTAFDFMHFTQTRISTIDSFSVFFIILMYYLMYIYYDSSADELPREKALLVLAACGTVFGLGIATKWICAYSGLGLALLFALATVRREKEDRGTWFTTCLWCVLFFVIIPFLIYFASYYPYYKADNTRSMWRIFLDNQTYMFSYHGKLTQTHPFQSPWYTWPADLRPIWFFGANDRVGQGMVSSIVSFGNPFVWWFGSAAMAAAVILGMKNRKLAFIAISFLSQYMPWALISRAVFIYHFFASVPFLILALVYALKYIAEKYTWGRNAAICFVVICGLTFCAFYPILSGMTVSRAYVRTFLKWFGSWTISY